MKPLPELLNKKRKKLLESGISVKKFLQEERVQLENRLADFVKLVDEVLHHNRKITKKEENDILKLPIFLDFTVLELNTIFPFEDDFIEPELVDKVIEYYGKKILRIKKIERISKNWNWSGLEEEKFIASDFSTSIGKSSRLIGIRNDHKWCLEEIEKVENSIKELDQEIKVREERKVAILQMVELPPEMRNEILKKFLKQKPDDDWFAAKKKELLLLLEEKVSDALEVKTKFDSFIKEILINYCERLVENRKEELAARNIFQAFKNFKKRTELVRIAEIFKKYFKNVQGETKAEEPPPPPLVNESYESSEEKEEPSNQPTTNPTAEQTQESNKNQPVTTETPTIPPKNKEQPDQKVSDNPPQENKTPNKPNLERLYYELLTKIKKGEINNIWKIIANSLLTEDKKQELYKLLDRQKNIVSQSKPNTNYLPWVLIGGGIMVVGLIGLVCRRKVRKKLSQP